jgi:hypothetical protein
MGKVNNIRIKLATSLLKGVSIQRDRSIPNSIMRLLNKTRSTSIIDSLSALSGDRLYTECYANCPPLQSIIRKKGEGLINGKIIPVDQNTEQAVNPPQEYKKAMEVINNPNVRMTRSQMLMYIDACLSVYDIAYLYLIKPIGMDRVTGIIPIPNNAITPAYKVGVNIADPTQFSDVVESYSINIMGMPLLLSGELTKLIYEVRGTGINLIAGNEFKQSSRIDSLKVPIMNIIGSMESRGQIITKRGAEGIISPKNTNDSLDSLVGFDATLKEKMQEEFEKFGYLSGQWHTMLSQIPVDYTPITKNVMQLGLFEGENSDKRTIALGYNMPTPLIGLPDEAKYNTFTEAQRQMYEGSVMPDAGIIAQAFDNIFKPNGWKFYFDFSHLGCFQESEADRADALDKTIRALKNGIDAGLIDQSKAKDIVNDFLN